MLSAQQASTRGYLDRVKLIRKNGDAEGVQKLKADIDADWGAKKDAAYYYVILELCGAVSSSPALDPNRTNLHRKLATAALDAPGDKPIYSEARLLLFLQGDPDYIQRKLAGADWEKERLIRVHRWLTTWQHLRLAKSQLPPDSGPAAVNLRPPSGGNQLTFAGMDPADIKDPVLRKQYEDAIAKNNEKHRINRQRSDLEDTEAAFIGPAKRYIINAYSQPPYDTKEMEMSLEKYGIDKDIRMAMVNEVRRLIVEKIEQDAKVAKALEANKAKAPESVPFRENPLSTDRRLRVLITVKMMKPKVEEFLTLLSSKTGLPITVSNHIPKDRLAFWSVSFNNVPAYVVMEELNKAVVDKGHWAKQENGYQLFGELKPTLESLREALVKERGAPPGRSGFANVLTIVSIIVLVGLAVWAFFYQRKHKTKI